MSADKPDDARTHDSDFAAMWSSDGATRSFSPSAPGAALPTELPFLFSAGQRFGPYLIVRPLGKGGMGQVYEAEEIDSGRRVAIKILSHGLGEGEDRGRFLREGQLAASLSHPNCVYVFGTSEIQGFPVIAMELAPGGTLKDLVVPRTPMAMATAVDAILQVIAGLDAAASIGILHRDIKPSNCFVDRDGRVMVGDFGLSMTTLGRADKTLTVAGTILGTPGFASPEQLRGEPLDVRSDIYSVGATLFYLLTGRPPFDDPNIMTMLTRVATEQAPQLTVVRPDLPGRLGSVVSRCLAKRPADRYATYTALASALEPFRSAAVTPAPLGRRFLAGAIDFYAAGLPAMPLNMYLGSILDATNRTELLMAQLPVIGVILAYYTILEGRFGCGVGKAVLNLRVVDEAQGPAGMRRALLRAMIFVLPGQIVNMVLGFLALGSSRTPSSDTVAALFAVASIAFGLTILVTLFSTARRRNGYAALHDRATRTRVVRRPAAIEARQAARRTALAEHATDPRGARLGPYLVVPGLPLAPVSEPAVVQGYDDRLRRAVWLELLPAGTPPLGAGRRDLGRPARARWLSGRRAGAECWDAYEAVEGQPFLRAIASPQPWSRVRYWMADLSDEIAAGVKDGTLPALRLDRIWIGSDDRARLLDWTPPPSPSATESASARLRPPSVTDVPQDPDPREIQLFLYGLAAGALRGVHPDVARHEPLAMPLPLPARTLLQSLKNGAVESLGAIPALADAPLRSPAAISIRRRAMQIAFSALLPVMMPIVVVAGIHLFQRSKTTDPDAYALKTCVAQLAGFDKLGSKMTAKQREDRELIEIYIAEHLSEAVEESAAVARSFPAVNKIRGEHAIAARALENHPRRSPEEVKRADAVVAKLLAEQTQGLAALNAPLTQWSLVLVMVSFTSAFVGVLALIGSLVARGGFTFRPFGTALVTRHGSLASRPRALLRAIVAWSPAALLCLLITKGPKPEHATVGSALLVTLAVLVFAAAAIWAMLHPSRGLQDRIAGTWIVPR